MSLYTSWIITSKKLDDNDHFLTNYLVHLSAVAAGLACSLEIELATRTQWQNLKSLSTNCQRRPTWSPTRTPAATQSTPRLREEKTSARFATAGEASPATRLWSPLVSAQAPSSTCTRDAIQWCPEIHIRDVKFHDVVLCSSFVQFEIWNLAQWSNSAYDIKMSQCFMIYACNGYENDQEGEQNSDP